MPSSPLVPAHPRDRRIVAIDLSKMDTLCHVLMSTLHQDTARVRGLLPQFERLRVKSVDLVLGLCKMKDQDMGIKNPVDDTTRVVSALEISGGPPVLFVGL